MSYITILLFLLVVTAVLEYFLKLHLFDSLKERVLWTFILFLVGTMWDAYAVSRGHWLFPGVGLQGVYIGNLPIEEYIFFLVVPYFILTLATAIRVKIR